MLLAIEGIDGSGKGTQAAKLVDALKTQGHRAASLQFPQYSATTFGAAIGQFLNGEFGSLDEVHPQLAAVLYACDRFESLKVLTKLQAANEIVILDRYVGSNLAHQTAKLSGAAADQLADWICRVEFDVFGLPRADVNILVDVTTETSRRLVEQKAARDYTDKVTDLQESDLPYLEKVRRRYRQIAERGENWTIVNCHTGSGSLRSVESIHEELLTIALQLLRTC